MIRFPYIRIRQRGETFFLTKFSVSYLFDKVDLHFRDPYIHLQDERYQVKNNIYLDSIRKKGLDLETDNEEGVQRRLQLNRILDIKKYIDEDVSNYFPNSVLISADTSMIDDFDQEQYLNLEQNEIGYFEFPDEARFSVIDGQHRLAGLFQASKIDKDNFEVPVVLLLDAGLAVAAKLFSDINGKQKAVSKSLIYDLLEHVDKKEVGGIKKYHLICQKFYTDQKSPLYRQIKMLGIGSGSISQSFFIDLSLKHVEPTLSSVSTQELYNQLFYYFRSYQKTFPTDWPVPLQEMPESERDQYSDEILKVERSQLLKTNGFGAIMRAFPDIYKMSGQTFDGYMHVISKLQGKVFWKRRELQQAGGGAELQKFLYNQIVTALKQ